jgi:hypothetical protein
MIYEHIISFEFGFNSFNATCDFNTKSRSSKGKMFKMNDKMVKKTQGKQ